MSRPRNEFSALQFFSLKWSIQTKINTLVIIQYALGHNAKTWGTSLAGRTIEYTHAISLQINWCTLPLVNAEKLITKNNLIQKHVQIENVEVGKWKQMVKEILHRVLMQILSKEFIVVPISIFCIQLLVRLVQHMSSRYDRTLQLM